MPQSRASPSIPPIQPPGWWITFAWIGALLFALSLGYFLYVYLVRFERIVQGDAPLRPILVDAALFTAFAAHHSVFARTRPKRWLQRNMHAAVERSLYTWIASLMFIAVCWSWQDVPGVPYRFPPAFAWIGYLVQACGVLLIIHASKRLDVLDLAGVRASLAVPSALERRVPLITTGVYALARHPIYLGWALFVFGSPTMTATRLVFAVISTTYLMVAIPWEERGLIREFGAAYEAYRRQVRWRMLPGIY